MTISSEKPKTNRPDADRLSVWAAMILLAKVKNAAIPLVASGAADIALAGTVPSEMSGMIGDAWPGVYVWPGGIRQPAKVPETAQAKEAVCMPVG